MSEFNNPFFDEEDISTENPIELETELELQETEIIENDVEPVLEHDQALISSISKKDLESIPYLADLQKIEMEDVITEYHASYLKDKIQSEITTQRKSFITTGKILNIFHSRRVFRLLGYDTFEEFLTSIGYSVTTAFRLIKIDNVLKKLHISPSDVADMDYTKIDKIAKYMTPENKDELLAQAKGLTVRDLDSYLRTQPTSEELQLGTEIPNPTTQLNLEPFIGLELSRAQLPNDKYRYTLVVTVGDLNSDTGRVHQQIQRTFTGNTLMLNGNQGNVQLNLSFLEDVKVKAYTPEDFGFEKEDEQENVTESYEFE